jgi:hypothetical protein
LARLYLDGAVRLLDMGTGDGARLRTLEPWPACTIAYEEWWPTVPAAVATLRPHGAPRGLPRRGRQSIAAFVAHARSVPWSVPEFDPTLMRDRLSELHDRCVRDGAIEAATPRFWLVARRAS